MLHKKQENILEAQSIRKTAPTNHASLDRFKSRWTWQTKNIADEQIKCKREDISYQFVFLSACILWCTKSVHMYTKKRNALHPKDIEA
jgi:hypothetical protein